MVKLTQSISVMYRKINKPEGQKELTSFLKRARFKSVSEIDKKKRTSPSTKRPSSKKQNINPAIPKIGNLLSMEIDENHSEDNMEITYDVKDETEKSRIRAKELEKEKELEEKLKMDAECLSKFSQEFREFGMMMNENMRRIQISQENKIEELMQPMKNSLITLIEAQHDQASQKEEIQEIKKKHEVLQQKCHQIEMENQDLPTRVTKLEIKMLEGNLIMCGLKEDPWELEDNLKERIYKAISSTVDDDHYSECIRVARNIGIRTAKRLGKYRKDKSRPVAVCFERKQHADILLENRSYLLREIYVDCEYTKEVESRRLLKPILRLAKRIPKYQGKCKLDDDTLVILGTKYTVNTMHLQPADLSGF